MELCFIDTEKCRSIVYELQASFKKLERQFYVKKLGEIMNVVYKIQLLREHKTRNFAGVNQNLLKDKLLLRK